MTKEEIETTFANHPYFAYKQGLQDGMAYTWDSFRREAAKDLLAAVMVQNGQDFFSKSNRAFVVKAAIELTDELIKQLREEKK